MQVTAMALRERVPEQLGSLLSAHHPELRAAAVFTLGALIQVPVCCVRVERPKKHKVSNSIAN